ncbi:MAG: MarC family protein [Phycisphaerales bacterium]|nr:MarC family protein [Phycisphaerales bacterium]MBT7171347.1 MarC family protein [Phycisphaerales bacterium]
MFIPEFLGEINWVIFSKAALSLFAVFNPFYVLPMFGGLVDDCNEKEQQFLFRTSALVAASIVMVMGVIGQVLVTVVFQVQIGSMLIAGGILLFVVALRNMVVGTTEEEKSVQQASDFSDQRRGQLLSRAVSPMAFPILVGPGSIITAILIVNEIGIAQGLLAMLVACTSMVMVMNYGHILMRKAGRIAPVVISRILMIFLAALGIDFVQRGVVELFPALKG